MIGHTSQNTLPRHREVRETHPHPALISVLAGLVFLGVLTLSVARFPGTDLGRAVVSHLSQLADPQSWTP
jgi:hypothetical protein